MHLLEKIQNLYGGLLYNTAKRLVLDSNNLEDMESDLLLAVYEWVVKYGYDVTEPKIMLTGIKQRGLDLYRKDNRYIAHYLPLDEALKRYLLRKQASSGVGEPSGTYVSDSEVVRRERELRYLVRKTVKGLDATIVNELVFPGSKTRAYARRHPVMGKRALRKVNHRRCAVVRKWHVAKVLGIPRRRVTLALANAAQVLKSKTYNWIGELNEAFESKTGISGKKK